MIFTRVLLMAPCSKGALLAHSGIELPASAPPRGSSPENKSSDGHDDQQIGHSDVTSWNATDPPRLGTS